MGAIDKIKKIYEKKEVENYEKNVGKLFKELNYLLDKLYRCDKNYIKENVLKKLREININVYYKRNKTENVQIKKIIGNNGYLKKRHTTKEFENKNHNDQLKYFEKIVRISEKYLELEIEQQNQMCKNGEKDTAKLAKLTKEIKELKIYLKNISKEYEKIKKKHSELKNKLEKYKHEDEPEIEMNDDDGYDGDDEEDEELDDKKRKNNKGKKKKKPKQVNKRSKKDGDKNGEDLGDSKEPNEDDDEDDEDGNGKGLGDDDEEDENDEELGAGDENPDEEDDDGYDGDDEEGEDSDGDSDGDDEKEKSDKHGSGVRQKMRRLGKRIKKIFKKRDAKNDTKEDAEGHDDQDEDDDEDDKKGTRGSKKDRDENGKGLGDSEEPNEDDDEDDEDGNDKGLSDDDEEDGEDGEYNEDESGEGAVDTEGQGDEPDEGAEDEVTRKVEVDTLNSLIEKQVDLIRGWLKDLGESRNTLNMYHKEEAKKLCKEINLTINSTNEMLLGFTPETDVKKARNKLDRLREIDSNVRSMQEKVNDKLTELTQESVKNVLDLSSRAELEVDEEKDSEAAGMGEGGDKPESHSEKEIEKAEKEDGITAKAVEKYESGEELTESRVEDEATEDTAVKGSVTGDENLTEETRETMEKAQNVAEKARGVAENSGWFSGFWRLKNYLFGSSKGKEDPDKASVEMKELKDQTEQVGNIADIMKNAKDLLRKLENLRPKMSKKRGSFQISQKLVMEINFAIQGLKMNLKEVNLAVDIDAAERKSLRLSNAVKKSKEVYEEASRQLGETVGEDSPKQPEQKVKRPTLDFDFFKGSIDSCKNLIKTIVKDITDKQETICSTAKASSDKTNKALLDSLLEKADSIVKNFKSEKERLEHSVPNNEYGDDLAAISRKYQKFLDALEPISKSANDELDEILAEIEKMKEETPPPLPPRSTTPEQQSKDNSGKPRRNRTDSLKDDLLIPCPIPQDKTGTASHRKSLSDIRPDPND